MKTVDHPNKCPLCLLEPRDGARLVPNDMVTSLFIQVAYGVSPYVFRVELPWNNSVSHSVIGAMAYRRLRIVPRSETSQMIIITLRRLSMISYQVGDFG
jgi:hypothetical protein